MTDLKPVPTQDPAPAGQERLASRVALTGIIAGLVLTAIGMIARSPVAGAAGLIILAALVLLRHSIARLIARSRA